MTSGRQKKGTGYFSRTGKVACPLFLLALTVPVGAAAQGVIGVADETSQGAIAGRVCQDLDRDGRCSAEEPGVPHLRLVLETGHSVVSDARGRYHFSAVSARDFEVAGQLTLRSGRHRVRVDDRALLPGTRVVPEAITLEVPLAGLVRQDFAVQEAARAELDVGRAPLEEAPQISQVAPDALDFELSGQVAPGSAVFVDGTAASVSETGVYRGRVRLRPGENAVAVRIESPDGAVALFRQRVDVIARAQSLLVVPREPSRVAQLQLPSTQEISATAGPTWVRVAAPPGAVVRHGSGQTVVPSTGIAEVPVMLEPGENFLSLSIESPGTPPQAIPVTVLATPRPLWVGLVEFEAGWRLGAPTLLSGARVHGRAAAHAEVPIGKWLIEGELDLRDQDLEAVRSVGVGVLALPRDVLSFERALDPEQHAATWADDSVAVVPNATDARVRVEAQHPKVGTLGVGTWRAQFGGSEVGQFHRALFGPWLSLHTDPSRPVSGAIQAFASPGMVDPVAGIASAPAHAEFLATGGSLFYLPHGAVLRGSERVRVLVRDGVTGVPISERHLVRGIDYELDALSGRLILAEPLSFAVRGPFFASDPMTLGTEPVLIVDYEHAQLGVASRSAAGAQAQGELGPVSLSVGGVQEAQGDERYRLLRASASGRLAGVHLSAEVAQSLGRAHADGDVVLSQSGGLEFVRPEQTRRVTDPSWAFGLRARGATPGGGHVDASWRVREAAFSDALWDARGALSQVSARMEQPIGPLRLGALADFQRTVDPRQPYGDEALSLRTLGGFVGWRNDSVELRVDAKDQALAAFGADGVAGLSGGRTSVGLLGRFRIHDRVWLQAGHKQVVTTRGEGPGAFDDSFSSAGADIALSGRSSVGLHGGWGPRLGALAWTTAQIARGPDVYYGSYGVDVDGPDFGERRAVTGARRVLEDGSSVFVEDVSSHDASSVRVARAVGFSYLVASAIEVSARYERGVRSVLSIPPSLQRDAGGFGVSWITDRVRLHARGEARFERGRPLVRTADAAVRRLQYLASLAANVSLLDNLQLSGRLNASTTWNDARLQARLLEGSTGLAWRWDPAILVLQYAIERELSPTRFAFGERGLQRVSFLPAVRLGDRFAVASGGHVGWWTADGNTQMVLAASVRPSVRVVGGLELAAEVARRSAAPDGGELTAVRGEAGYRFGDSLLMAVGYTFFGYQGLGLSPDTDRLHRLYLRAESAW